MKQRGRPRHDSDYDLVQKDEAIARTAQALIMWGFSRRTKKEEDAKIAVYEVVGKLAKEILNRTDFCGTDPYGMALGPDRIEQIHEEWRAKEKRRAREEARMGPAGRAIFMKKSLQRRAPNKSLEDIAAILLRNGGKWPERAPIMDALTGKITCLIDLSTGRTEPCRFQPHFFTGRPACLSILNDDDESVFCPGDLIGLPPELTPKAEAELEMMPEIKKRGNKIGPP